MMATETQKKIDSLQKELEQAKQQIAELENQLVSQKAHSQQFFDMVDDGVVILKNKVIVDCNPKTIELLGANSKDEIVGLTLFDLSHPTNNQAKEFINEKIDSVLAGTPHNFRWIAKQSDNTSIPLGISLSKLNNGNSPHLIMIARDISDHIEYEKKILKQQNTLQVFLDAIHESICLVDKDFKVLFANETLASRFDTTIDQILNTTITDWFPIEIRQKRIDYAKQVLETGKELFFEDGRNGRSILNLLYPIFDQGEVSQIAVLSIDTTEKKEIKSELNKLQQALESSPSTVIITNPEGIAEYVNPAFTVTTGYTKDEILGKKANLVRSHMHDDAFFKEMWDTIRSGGFWRGEVCNRKKSGELFWELVSISPIINGEGKVTNYVAIKEDISNKKDLEQLKADIDRMMRHDLKTPLNSLIGIPQLLELEGGLSDSQQELVKAIEDAGRRMLHMIDLSLTLFQMESGTYDYQPKDIDLCTLVNKVVTDSQPKYSSKQLNIDIKKSCCNDTAPCLVSAERDLLYSVLTTFLLTAIEASPTGETISIEVTERRSKKVMFKNRGVVPEKIREHFFGKYKTRDEEKRVGLDTYSAKLFTDTMGLLLAMNTSDEDNLTTITLSFPEQND